MTVLTSPEEAVAALVREYVTEHICFVGGGHSDLGSGCSDCINPLHLIFSSKAVNAARKFCPQREATHTTADRACDAKDLAVQCLMPQRFTRYDLQIQDLFASFSSDVIRRAFKRLNRRVQRRINRYSIKFTRCKNMYCKRRYLAGADKIYAISQRCPFCIDRRSCLFCHELVLKDDFPRKASGRFSTKCATCTITKAKKKEAVYWCEIEDCHTKVVRDPGVSQAAFDNIVCTTHKASHFLCDICSYCMPNDLKNNTLYRRSCCVMCSPIPFSDFDDNTSSSLNVIPPDIRPSATGPEKDVTKSVAADRVNPVVIPPLKLGSVSPSIHVMCSH